MANGQHESVIFMFFESNKIGKPFDGRLSDECRCLFSAWPSRKQLRSIADSLNGSADRRDEFFAQPLPPFLIPQRRGAELGARLRM